MMMDEKISISLIKLRSLGLTPNEYVWLRCKFHNVEISDYPIDTQKLENEGYIKSFSEQWVLRDKAEKLFDISSIERKWLDLITRFPIKVPGRNGETRPLGAADPDAKANAKAKAKYALILKKDIELHDKIIACLDAELEMRRSSSTLQYMNSIEVWLNQRVWEKYEYLLEEKKNDNELRHGERLI